MSISVLRQQVNAFFEALEAVDADRVSNVLSEDFNYYRHPRPAEAHWDKAAYLEHVPVLKFYVRWNPNIKHPISIVENEEKRQLVILHSAEPLAVNGKTYNPEYVWFFHFNEAGKIDLLREMVDTVYVETLQADFKAYQAQSSAA